MIASTGGLGTCAHPSVAAASVMLCARVKAVTVATIRFPPRTISRSAKTKSRWSVPLNAEHEVRQGNLSGARGRSHREFRFIRRKALDLTGSIQSFDADDYISNAIGAPADANFFPSQAGRMSTAVGRSRRVHSPQPEWRSLSTLPPATWDSAASCANNCNWKCKDPAPSRSTVR